MGRLGVCHILMAHNHHRFQLCNFCYFFVDKTPSLLDHLVGKPLDVRNCLTVDALIPKFTFSESELMVGGVAI